VFPNDPNRETTNTERLGQKKEEEDSGKNELDMATVRPDGRPGKEGRNYRDCG